MGCSRAQAVATAQPGAAGDALGLAPTECPYHQQTPMLNRSALVVRPKQPFLDWAAQLDDSGLAPLADGEQTIYLIPEYDDDEDAVRILNRVFAEVFERELFAWHTDETAWPKGRNLALFQKWFDVEFHSIVEDLCDFEIIDDEA